MEWWLWAVLGIVLLVSEVLTPSSFFLFFFGCAGLALALLTGIGIGGPIWLQWALFSLISIVLLLVVRRKLLSWTSTGKQHKVDNIEGESALIRTQIAPGEIGQVELRGSTWNGKNLGTLPLLPGSRAIVLKVNGLTLELKREDE